MGIGIYISEEYKNELSSKKYCIFGETESICRECDIIIVIGGDGTILEASVYAAEYGKLLLGINTGRLGFMASMETDELYNLSRLISGDYIVEKRMMISCEYISENGSETFTALNDVFLGRPYAGISDYYVTSGDITVTSARADGLIISTPTGSTAYALSAGGPILDPHLECIQVTSICPHSLFSRPMIFSADKTLTVHHTTRGDDNVYFTVDGKVTRGLRSGESLVISKSEKYLRLIDITGRSFYDAVNNKLINPLK